MLYKKWWFWLLMFIAFIIIVRVIVWTIALKEIGKHPEWLEPEKPNQSLTEYLKQSGQYA